jgi:nitroreductase
MLAHNRHRAAAGYARHVEFRDVLRQRRMVRNYVPEPVPGDVLERIVATVRRAPSGGFSQGQRLLVVTDAATRREIARLAGEEESRAQGFEPWISEAPAHVVVCTREEDWMIERKPHPLNHLNGVPGSLELGPLED